MMSSKNIEVEVQQKYYADTARKYDEMHVDYRDEHFFALRFMLAYLDYFEIKSVLDIGSGTGRALHYIKEHRPDISVCGVEPVEELRVVAYESGISTECLKAGDATSLDFDDGAFDLVCEFGILHHIRQPSLAVSEMLRVSRKAVFISDANNFGAGSWLSRTCKQIAHQLKLWPFVDWMKTGGKRYVISEGDGLAYSYSVFDSYDQVRQGCSETYLLNTRNASTNLYRTATHVALFGVK